MNDPNAVLYDGDHDTPFLCAAAITWIDEETRASMTKLKYRVRKPFYHPLARGSTNPNAPGGYVVGQPQPRIVGGDLYEFELLFATIPQRPTEPIPYVYPWQFKQFTDDGVGLTELPIPVTALASYRYYHTSQPENIALAHAFKAAEFNNKIVYLGDVPRPGVKYLLAEDETIRRVWPGGDMWEVKSITVPLRTPQSLTS